jgi:hypothetical protein
MLNPFCIIYKYLKRIRMWYKAETVSNNYTASKKDKETKATTLSTTRTYSDIVFNPTIREYRTRVVTGARETNVILIEGEMYRYE